KTVTKAAKAYWSKTVTKAAKAYWSKMSGINRESCQARIPDFRGVTLLHDPMDVLLEGVIPYESQLFLFHAIIATKYFTLKWLNAALCRFPYTYLDKSKPETIQRNDLVDSKPKQTSAAMLTLVNAAFDSC
ncbi:hypothetical protein LSAT2_012750, partial [Lamellibrachia satsuma]